MSRRRHARQRRPRPEPAEASPAGRGQRTSHLTPLNLWCGRAVASKAEAVLGGVGATARPRESRGWGAHKARPRPPPPSARGEASRERGLDRLGLHHVRLLCHRLRGGGELLGKFAFTLLRLRELALELLEFGLEAVLDGRWR